MSEIGEIIVDMDNNNIMENSDAPAEEPLTTHKYRGSQQFSRVEYSTQIHWFDLKGAKEYLKVLAAELSIQPHLEINYLQQSD